MDVFFINNKDVVIFILNFGKIKEIIFLVLFVKENKILIISIIRIGLSIFVDILDVVLYILVLELEFRSVVMILCIF